METIVLNDKDIGEMSSGQAQTEQLIYFIELTKRENKKIKIPCSNKLIAEKISIAFNKLKP